MKREDRKDQGDDNPSEDTPAKPEETARRKKVDDRKHRLRGGVLHPSRKPSARGNRCHQFDAGCEHQEHNDQSDNYRRQY